jgi:twitching motility protein PilT
MAAVNVAKIRINVVRLSCSPLLNVTLPSVNSVTQREVPTHSPTFEQAIIDALRENPDVLVMSEMRTPEVIRLTSNAQSIQW